MNIDMDKVLNLAVNKKNKKDINLTTEELSFMEYIFDKIIYSEDYEETLKYLSGIHELSISDLKLIRNVFLLNYATKDEIKIYKEHNKKINKLRRKEGFIDITAMISISIFLSTIGITIAFIILNNN